MTWLDLSKLRNITKRAPLSASSWNWKRSRQLMLFIKMKKMGLSIIEKKYFYRKEKMKISALLSFALAAKGKFRDIIMLWHYHTLFQIFNFRLKMANLRQPVKFRNKTSRLKSVLISDFLYRFFRFCTKSVAEVVENWQVTVPHWNKSPLSGYFGLKGVLFRRQ